MAPNTFTDAAELSAEWLCSQLDDDGRIGPSLYFYDKVPHALLDTGRFAEANAALDWIARNGLTDRGDFDVSGNPEPEGERWRIWAPRMRPYQNAVLVMAAHRLGRFDVSMPAYDRLLAYQDPAVGGFGHSTPDGDEFDLVSTGFCGLACLYLGDVDRAKRAGESVLALLDGQPALDDALYVNLDADGDVITDGYPDAGEEFYVVYADREDQMYFYPGCAVKLLASLHLATGEQRYLDGAVAFVDFARSCRSVFEHGSAGKLAWGCLTLAEATGDDEYLDVARRIGEFIVSLQDDDGSYDLPGNDPADRYTLTAEFTMWTAALSGHLD